MERKVQKVGKLRTLFSEDHIERLRDIPTRLDLEIEKKLVEWISQMVSILSMCLQSKKDRLKFIPTKITLLYLIVAMKVYRTILHKILHNMQRNRVLMIMQYCFTSLSKIVLNGEHKCPSFII
jgi:hypothetical protein